MPAARLRLVAAAVSVSLLLIGGASAQSLRLFSVFGDSLSDTGDGFFRLSNNTAPDPNKGYWRGRFSDGPLWADYLELRVGKAYVYAVGDATAGPSSLTRFPGIPIPDLPTQVSSWLADVSAAAARGKPLSARRAAILWIGGNDLLDAFLLSLPGRGPESQALAGQVLANITRQTAAAVDRLLGSGETRVVVVSLPPADLSPVVSGPVVPLLASAIAGVNNATAQAMAQLRLKYPAAKIEIFDPRPLLTKLQSRPRQFGFREPKRACVVPVPPAINPASPFANATRCGNNGQFIFFDEKHITTAVNMMLAEDMYKFMQDKDIA